MVLVKGSDTHNTSLAHWEMTAEISTSRGWMGDLEWVQWMAGDWGRSGLLLGTLLITCMITRTSRGQHGTSMQIVNWEDFYCSSCRMNTYNCNSGLTWPWLSWAMKENLVLWVWVLWLCDTYWSSQVEYYTGARRWANITNMFCTEYRYTFHWQPAARSWAQQRRGMINFDYYFPSLLNHFCVWPSHSPLRKLLNILDKCWEAELTTLIQKLFNISQFSSL